MNDKKIFADSNVFLYLLDQDIPKKRRAAEILFLQPFISPQVIFENINVAIKKFGLSKADGILHGVMLLDSCPLVMDTDQMIRKSFELLERYPLQVYDSRILASALDAGCEILFTEDFQHEQVFDGQLTIVNPFLI